MVDLQIGLTAIHFASANGYIDIIEVLVKKYNASLDIMSIVSMLLPIRSDLNDTVALILQSY